MKQMRIFLDANILVAVLNKEYPLYTYAARVLSLASNQGYKLYVSPLSLAIAAYFSAKKSGKELATKKISLLIKHIHLTSITESEVKQALENKQVTDFEDGMQYYSAKAVGCTAIVTEDVGDYYFSEIPVYTARAFLHSLAKG